VKREKRGEREDIEKREREERGRVENNLYFLPTYM